HGQNRTDDDVEAEPQLSEKCTSADSHLNPPVARIAAGRCVASHATTSEMSCGDIDLPGTSLRQSGAPMSGRPAITVVRKLWSLTIVRYALSTIELARGPPRPAAP